VAPDEFDDLDLVMEAADMLAVFAAQRLARIHGMRVRALAEAERQGRTLTGVPERSVRLELACALRITEHAADALLSLAEAVVVPVSRGAGVVGARADDGAARHGAG
jgi:hypothetical protein